jgi:hypothetical protein
MKQQQQTQLKNKIQPKGINKKQQTKYAITTPKKSAQIAAAAVIAANETTRRLDKENDVDLLDVDDKDGTVKLITGEVVLDQENRPIVLLNSPLSELQRRYICNVKAKKVHGRSLLDDLNSVSLENNNHNNNNKN